MSSAHIIHFSAFGPGPNDDDETLRSRSVSYSQSQSQTPSRSASEDAQDQEENPRSASITGEMHMQMDGDEDVHEGLGDDSGRAMLDESDGDDGERYDHHLMEGEIPVESCPRIDHHGQPLAAGQGRHGSTSHPADGLSNDQSLNGADGKKHFDKIEESRLNGFQFGPSSSPPAQNNASISAGPSSQSAHSHSFHYAEDHHQQQRPHQQEQQPRYIPPSSSYAYHRSSGLAVPPMPYTSFSFQQSSAQMSRTGSASAIRTTHAYPSTDSSSWDARRHQQQVYTQGPPPLSSSSTISNASPASSRTYGHAQQLSDGGGGTVPAAYSESRTIHYQQPSTHCPAQVQSQSRVYVPRSDPVAIWSYPSSIPSTASSYPMAASSSNPGPTPMPYQSSQPPAVLSPAIDLSGYSIEYGRAPWDGIRMRKVQVRAKREPMSPSQPPPPPLSPKHEPSPPVPEPLLPLPSSRSPQEENEPNEDDQEWKEPPKVSEKAGKSRSPNGNGGEKKHVW